MLSSPPALALSRPHIDHRSQARWVHLLKMHPLKKKEKKVVVCVFTSALAQKKDIWGPDALGRSCCCWFLQVPGAAGEGFGEALISDFWQGKHLLQSLAPSLAFFSLLPAPTEPPNYCMEENIFLPLPELLIGCLQKIIFRSLQHFPLLHSITLWTHNLVQNENPSEGTSMNFRVNTNPASCHGPNSFLLQLQCHAWNYSGRKSCLQPHNQMAVHEDVLLIAITEC